MKDCKHQLRSDWKAILYGKPPHQHAAGYDRGARCVKCGHWWSEWELKALDNKTET